MRLLIELSQVVCTAVLLTDYEYRYVRYKQVKCVYSIHNCIPLHTAPTKPRNLKFTRVCKDGVELNWMPPREPNGELHYIIQYGSNTTNTASNLTYYNLTGLVNGTTYYITVIAVNSAGSSTSDVKEYTHVQSSENG